MNSRFITSRPDRSGYNSFDTLIVLVKQYFECENNNVKKVSRRQHTHRKKCPVACKVLNLNMSIHVDCNELEVINDKVYQVNVLHEIA